ncbi:DNA-directed DNA polymerase [Malassezia vespertilionis]|nr:DNA-directed DNA polymerase [Malassezia vespertilionis]WFD06863.1 DNA-directed DNA polymerase [Malassezia vespertilionis]
MSSTLALFWGLTAVEKKARLEASDNLVNALVAQQDTSLRAPRIEPPALLHIDAEDEEAQAAEERLDQYTSGDVSYSIRRLVRGLASPRENARLGFAVALSELLQRLPGMHAHDVLILLLKHTVVRGNMSGQEARDLHFARLFGIYALVRSGILYADNASLTTFQRSFQVLLAIAAYKSWLSEPSGYVLVQALEPLAKDAMSRPSWADEAIHWSADRICTNKDLSPEKLALFITFQRIDPGLAMEPRIVPPLKSEHLLAASNLPVIARALKEAAPLQVDGDKGAHGPGTWTTHLPFVWNMLLDTYFSVPDASPPNTAPFADFFRIVVDETLFANSASPERKSWGFQVLHKALERAPADVLPFLFTPNLMRTWINQLTEKNRLLHSMAQKTVTYVSEAVKRNPTAGLALVTQLLGEHGRQNFDRVTHTKTIESILSSLDESGIRRYLAYLRGVAYAPAPGDDEKLVTSHRQWVCDQMLALVRSNLVPRMQKWVEDVLLFFAAFGYFAVAKTPKGGWDEILTAPAAPFSKETRTLCQMRLQACLAELKGPNQAEQPWLLAVQAMHAKMWKDDTHFSPTVDDAVKARIEGGTTVLRSVGKAAEKTSKEDVKTRMHAFTALLAAVMLVTYEDDAASPDLVAPLVDAAKSLFPEKKSKREARQEDSAVELLVDILVDLLEISSAFLRAVVSRTFAVFSASISAASLDHLVAQLGVNAEGAGEEMVDEGYEEVEEDENEDDDDDDDNDDDDNDDDNDNDNDDDNDSHDDDTHNDQVDPILRSRIEEAFRASGMVESDEDDAFDDDQMTQLDDKLAEIFKQHSNSRRKESEVIQRDTALFHNKILDLLEIYAKEQSASPLLVRLAAPLFALARGHGDTTPQVATRASQILRSRVCRPKEQVRGDIDAPHLLTELEHTLAFLRTSQDAPLTELGGAVCQFYTKVLLRNDDAQLPEIVKAYDATLRDFLQRKASPVRPAFLLDTIRRFSVLGWALRQPLLDGSRYNFAARTYRQVQDVNMLLVVLQQQCTAETRHASVPIILAFIAKVRDSILDTIRAAVEPTEESMNAQRLKEVLRFALQAVRITARIVSGEKDATGTMTSCWPPAALQDTLAQLQRSPRFSSSTSLHGLLKEMLAVVQRTGTSEALQKNKKRAPATDAAPHDDRPKAAKRAKPQGP